MSVFISYRRKGGSPMARLLETKLKAQGYKVYLDVHTAERGVYTDRHKRQVQTSSDLILVLSPGSMDDCFDPRDAVVQEIRWALEAGVNIIPYVLEGFRRPLSAPPEVNKVLDIQGVEDSTVYAESAFEKLLSLMKDSPYTTGVGPSGRHTNGAVRHDAVGTTGLDRTPRPPRRSGGFFRFLLIIALLIVSAGFIHGYITGTSSQVITLNANPTENAVLLTWTTVEEPYATYTLSVQDSTGTWRSRITTSGTSYTDSRVEPGKTYRYRITAQTKGREIASAEQQVRVPAASPIVVTTKPVVTATPTPKPVSMQIFATPRSGAVQLDWTGVSISGIRYVLMRRIGDSDDWLKLTQTSATSFTDDTAWPGTVYQYRITATAFSYDYATATCTGVALDTATPVPDHYKYLPVIPAGGIHANCGSRQSIMWVQQCLRKLLNMSLSVDGNWGSMTEEAVLQFKRIYGLPADNAFLQADEVQFMLDLYVKNHHPLEYLASYAAPEGAAASNAAVTAHSSFDPDRYLPLIPAGGVHAGCGSKQSIMWVQQCLRRIGYGSLAVDGNWGSVTENAVLEFKKTHGFSAANSVLTRDVLLAMLQEYYNKNQPLEYLEGYAAP